jgi:uncharacterized protein (TIGR03067 family)
MRLLTTLCGLFVAAVFLAGAPASAQTLPGNWIATKAEQDGKPVAEIVGHRLSFNGDRFELSKDGKTLWAGTFHTDTIARPAAIDFQHTEGPLAGKAWKGIYALDGDALTICDNAPDLTKDRPTSFAAGPGSGYVLVTFARARN